MAATTKHQLEREAKIERFYIPKVACCDSSVIARQQWLKKEACEQKVGIPGRRRCLLFVSTLITTAVGP